MNFEPVERIGRFSISDLDLHLFMGGSGSERGMKSRPHMHEFCKHFLVLRAEHLFRTMAVEYTAHSDLFDLTSPTERTPEYKIQWREKDDGSFDIWAERIAK